MTTAIILAALVLAADAEQQTPPASPPQAPASPPAQAPPSSSAQQPPSAQQPARPPAESATVVDGVTVTGGRPEVRTSIDRRSYSVANDVQGQTGSIADVLRNIPSVQVDVNGNISLRGDSNVRVLLDGQPSSQFRGDSLAQALQTLPASRIERIEVITNPSAAFSAEGAGIINLITKRATGEGRTGSIQAMVNDQPGGRLVLVGGYNSNKLRLTGDISLLRQSPKQFQDHRRSEIDPVTGATSNTRERVNQKADSDFAVAHVGAEYDLDGRTRLTGDLRVGYSDRNSDLRSHFELRDPQDAPVLVFDRFSPSNVTQATYIASTAWRRRYGNGHDLTFLASWDRQDTDVDRFETRTTSVPPQTPEVNTQVFNSNFVDQTILRGDYNRPLADEAKLQLGFESVFVHGGITNAGGQSTGGGPVPLDPALDDVFEPEATRNDVYITYERPFGDLTVLGGLRAQVVNLDLVRVTQAVTHARSYSNLYPTLHLGYELGEGRQLTASYSRRVNRPIFADLNPFQYSTSPQSAYRGNPDLKPERTDSFEAGYERRAATSTFLATLYYRSTSDAFTVVATDLGNGVLLSERANAGERRNGGLELAMGGRLIPKVTYNLSGNIYWSEIKAPGLGFNVDRSGTTGFGRANLNWQVTPKDLIQLNVFANGKVIYPQGYSPPTASGNIGYRHRVNDKLAWMLVVQDPFGTLRSRLFIETPNGVIRRELRNNSRQVSFTLVKNFGGGRPREPTFDFVPGGQGGGGLL